MTTLPNPFCSDACHTSETAAASPVSSQVDAAADIPLVELERRGFDADAFLTKIAPDVEPLPVFLAAPSSGYLRATDILPVLMTLAGR